MVTPDLIEQEEESENDKGWIAARKGALLGVRATFSAIQKSFCIIFRVSRRGNGVWGGP